MSRFRIKLHKQAVKFLNSLPARQKERVSEKLDRLAENLFDVGHLDVKPMIGEAGLWRLRVGPIRAIYEVQNDRLIVYVLTIGYRGDVYKRP